MTAESAAGPAYQRIAEALRMTVLRSPDAELRLPTEAELAELEFVVSVDGDVGRTLDIKMNCHECALSPRW